MSADQDISFGKRTLRPRARIMRTLGDELISSDIVAVVELVKNAYDADASRVLIQIENPIDGPGTIEIIDNGHGMSLSTVQNVWMEPATLYKKYSTNSEFGGRRVLGNKGIGRFATSRLAERLELITRRINTNNEVVAKFDWRQFDDDNKYLDEIEIDWLQREPSEICKGGTSELLWNKEANDETPSDNELSRGTILRLVGLKSVWTKEQIALLRNNLTRMVLTENHLSNSENKELVIRLKEPFNINNVEDDRISSSNLLNNPPYKLYGMVNANGDYKLQITVKGKGEDVFLDGKLPDAPMCGPFGIILEVWDRDKEALKHLTDGDLSLKNIRDALDKVAGISIYRDGFRVLPYGEPNSDWLRLDIRSRQNPTKNLANNQIIGFIAITADGNPTLKDQSNREGIMEGPAMDHLRLITKELIKNIEDVRYKIRRPVNDERKKNNSSTRKGFFDDINFDFIYDSVKRKHPDDVELISAIEEKEKTIKLKMVQFQEVLSRYRRHSTLGQLIDIVLHEGRAPIAKIKNEAILAKRDIVKESWSSITLDKTTNRFISIANQADVLANVFNRLEPFSGRKREAASLCLIETIVKQAVDVLSTTIQETNTRIKIPITTTDLIVEKSEIQEIVLNLLDNSLYWLKEIPAQDREIVILVDKLADKSVEIILSDSGPGINKEDKEYIFDPYYTKRLDGVGLGLTIAGEIASDYYNGKLELVDTGPLPGATFRIILNGRV